MSTTHLSIIPCDDWSAWDDFVQASPQGNVFCTKHFMLAQGYEQVHRFFVVEKQTPVAATFLFSDKGNILSQPTPYSLYQGILFSQHFEELRPHSKSPWILNIVTFLLEQLMARFPKVSFCLDPSFQDVRAFQWINYHQREKGVFSVQVRYSARLCLNALTSLDSYLSELRTTRRQEYNRCIRENATIETSSDIDLFEGMMRRNYERQNIHFETEHAALFRRIAHILLAENKAKMLLCKDSLGDPVSMTLFAFDHRGAYYLFGANEPEKRRLAAGTYLMVESIFRAKQRGLEFVDFIGVNSPNRGDFKCSFNPLVIPYFQCEWVKPA